MGDIFGEGSDDEKPIHEVCVDDFYLSKYEVTQGEWEKVMGNNPSNFKNGDNYPVEQVSWEEIQKFITRLNQNGQGKYRLPTEAEWEYACRSGGKRERYSGSNSIDSVALYWDNAGKQTHKVGIKTPNGFGLYDMSGNVWEWVQDWYDLRAYSNHSRYNPISEHSSKWRVQRGGSWFDSAKFSRCMDRGSGIPKAKRSGLGFRLAKSP